MVRQLTALRCLQVPPGSPKPSPLIISELPAPGVTKARLMPINEGEVGKGRGCAAWPCLRWGTVTSLPAHTP